MPSPRPGRSCPQRWSRRLVPATARSRLWSQETKSANAPTSVAMPPKPHMTTPASCWSCSAAAAEPWLYDGYQVVAAIVISSPSALAGSVATNSTRTPPPRRRAATGTERGPPEHHGSEEERGVLRGMDRVVVQRRVVRAGEVPGGDGTDVHRECQHGPRSPVRRRPPGPVLAAQQGWHVTRGRFEGVSEDDERSPDGDQWRGDGDEQHVLHHVCGEARVCEAVEWRCEGDDRARRTRRRSTPPSRGARAGRVPLRPTPGSLPRRRARPRPGSARAVRAQPQAWRNGTTLPSPRIRTRLNTEDPMPSRPRKRYCEDRPPSPDPFR